MNFLADQFGNLLVDQLGNNLVDAFDPAIVAPSRVLRRRRRVLQRIAPRKKLPLLIVPPMALARARRPVIAFRKRPRLRRAGLRYPLALSPPSSFNQGIAFRKTSGFVVDAANFDFGSFGLTANYPQLTKQGHTVGFTQSSGTILGQDENALQDPRLAGNITNTLGTPVPTGMSFIPPSPAVSNNSGPGTTVCTITVTTSDASAFSGSLTLVSNPGGLMQLAGNSIQTAVQLTPANNGSPSFTVRATQNAVSIQGSVTIVIS